MIDARDAAPIDETKQSHGGKRAGAGRKKSGRQVGSAHRTRPKLSFEHAVHVTLRVVRGEGIYLRKAKAYVAIRKSLLMILGRSDFRVNHLSIQRDHIHFIVEADDEQALAKGMQALTSSLARRINTALGHEGQVFQWRYSAKQIRDAHYARNALCYVLNNWRKHRADRDGATRMLGIDVYSSGVSFDGWYQLKPFHVARTTLEPLPVSAPRTSLLGYEWMQFGLVSVDEVPGPPQIDLIQIPDF